MKFLLSTLLTLSIGAPIVSVTANAIEYNNVYVAGATTGENLVALNQGGSSTLDSSIGHEEKLKYVGESKDADKINDIEGSDNHIYVSNNYTVGSNIDDTVLIDGETQTPIVSTFGSNTNQFTLEDKTFASTVSDNSGYISWVDQAINDEGRTVTYQQNTGITYDPTDPNLNRTPTAIPFTYFGSDDEHSRQSFIISTKFEKTTKPTSFDILKVNPPKTTGDILDQEYKAFGAKSTIKIADLGVNAPEKGAWTISSLVAQNFDKYSEKLDDTGMLNRVIVGLYSKEDQITEYIALDATSDADGNVTLKRAGSQVVTDSNASDDDTTYRLYATLDNGDVLFKIGTGGKAVYALGSFFNDGNPNKLSTGAEVLGALGAATDGTQQVGTMFSTNDHKLVFQVNSGTSNGLKNGMYNSDFYYIDLGDTLKGLNFANKSGVKLFSTDVYQDDTAKNWLLMAGVPNVISGVVLDQNTGSTKYNYIATVSAQQKAIVYKYKNANQFGQDVQGIGGSIDEGPILETIYQSSGFIDASRQNQVSTIAYVNNNFLISNNVYHAGSKLATSYVATLSEKISNADITEAIGKTVELTQDAFNNISAAYPDKSRNSEAVRYVFLEALVTGRFTYNTSYTDYPFSDDKWQTYTSDRIMDASLVGRLDGKFSVLSDALNNAIFTVNGEEIKSPSGETNTDPTNQITIDVDSESLDQVLRYKQYGSFDYTGQLTIKTDGNNSFVNGDISVAIASAGVTSSFDVDDINEDVKESIKKDYSDFNITGYSTPSEVTGYVLNKINNVIYDESRKYSGDKNIPKLLSEFGINQAVSNNPEAVSSAWNEYHTSFKDKEVPVYNDSFDGRRPFILTDDTFYSENIVDTAHKGDHNITESFWRNNMDWGWQDTNSYVTNDNDATTTANLTNIVLTTRNTGAISIIRGSSDVTRKTEDQDGSGIMYYGDNKVNASSILLNIGETLDDGTNNFLRATVNTSEINKLSSPETIDSAATADLDSAAKTITNAVIGMGDGSAKTSIFRYFEKIKKEFNLAPNVQLSLDWNKVTNGDYFVPEGDNKKFDIIIYDAIFFNSAIKFDSTSMDLSNPTTASANHFKVVSIYLSNGQNHTKMNSIIIFASVFGGILILFFATYTIYVSMRKSFYKRGTTREAAKQSSILRKYERQLAHDKKNKDKDNK